MTGGHYGEYIDLRVLRNQIHTKPNQYTTHKKKVYYKSMDDHLFKLTLFIWFKLMWQNKFFTKMSFI